MAKRPASRWWLLFVASFAWATLGWASAAWASEAAPPPPGAGARTPLRVVLPDPDNLQYMSFWVALGAGYFDEEGFSVEISCPKVPAVVDQLMKEQQPPAAVLPPPVYLQLIADEFPLRIVANLLTNDGINLIVRRSVAEQRKLSPTAPLAERLRGLHGLRIGVAPGPVTRLRELFSTVGLAADKEMSITVVPGKDQNDLFGQGRVDALYAHSPYLEKALVDQDAMMLVNQSAGEVAPLSGLQIHALVVAPSFADAHPDGALGLVRAIYRAEALVHRDQRAATAAVLRALPKLSPPLVEAIVRIYEPAVPADPHVTVEGLSKAVALFPARKVPPALQGRGLAAFVEPRFAEQVMREGRASGWRSRRWLVIAGTAAAVSAAAAVVVVRRRRAAKR